MQEGQTDYSTIAGQGLLMIQEIFALEKVAPKNPGGKRKYTLEETAEIRKEKSADKVTEFFEFCEENQGFVKKSV